MKYSCKFYLTRYFCGKIEQTNQQTNQQTNPKLIYMKKSFLLIGALAFMLVLGCTKTNKNKNSNSFMADFSTPFQVPAFDQIDTTDYMPAAGHFDPS